MRKRKMLKLFCTHVSSLKERILQRMLSNEEEKEDEFHDDGVV
jgi:hypothetical protein